MPQEELGNEWTKQRCSFMPIKKNDGEEHIIDRMIQYGLNINFLKNAIMTGRKSRDYKGTKSTYNGYCVIWEHFPCHYFGITVHPEAKRK